MKSSLMRARWAAIGAAVAVSLGGGVVLVANADSYPTTEFTAITPCRLLDTRTDDLANKVENLGIRKGAIQDKTKSNTVDNDIVVIFDKDAKAGASNSFTQQYGNTDFRPIMGDCDAEFVEGGDFEIGSGGTTLVEPVALLLNVTTVGSTASGFVTVYPWQALSGSPLNRPFFSSLNPISSLPSVSNNVTVALATSSTQYISNVKCASGTHGASGSDCSGFEAFRVYNENGNTHIIIDVLGYYL